MGAPACIGPVTIGGGIDTESENKAPDALDEALASGGLDRASLGLSAERTALSRLAFDDPRMLEGTRAVMRHPLRLRTRGREIGRAFDEAMASDTPVTRAITAASSLREAPVTACIDPAWLVIPPGKAPLAVAVAQAAGLKTKGVPDLGSATRAAAGARSNRARSRLGGSRE